MNRSILLKHESGIPLDDSKTTVINLNTDELEDLSPLHQSLCKQTFHGVVYQKIELETESDVEISLNMLDKVLCSLHWLLSLQYEQFWCQVVNDKSVHSCLDSYLHYAPRFYQSHWPNELLEKHSSVHRAVFMIFLRMSTLKESNRNFMTKDLFSKLIYENFLFDIPRLMDLCSLYGMPENRPLLKKMLENIFHSQPKFYEDLKQAAKTVSEVLRQIEEKCLGTSENKKKPNKISEGHSSLPLHKMKEEELADVIFYISDTTRTLQAFIGDVFDEAAQAFHEHNLIERLIAMYCEILPLIRDHLREEERTLGGEVYLELRGHVRRSRDCIMQVVNAIIGNLTYHPAVEAAKGKNDEKANEFAVKYFQICPNVGEAHSEFLFNALPGGDISDDEETRLSGEAGDSNFDQPGSSKATSSQAASSTSDTQLSPLVVAIRDVLPDLDIDFVKKCLVYYELNPEKVIQAIFEQNLPPHLAENSQNGFEKPGTSASELPKEPEKPEDQPSSSKSVDFLHERKNIFDNDEFDVFASGSSIDKSRIHYGKKDKGKIDHWTSGTEEDVGKLRQLYNRYGLGAEDTDNDDMLLRANPISNYEDEYDDTYDDVAVGANDADSVDEFGDEKDNGRGSKEEERPQQTYRNRHFVQNPEEQRAREEDRRKRREEYFSRRGGRTNSKQSRAAAGVPQGSKDGPGSSTNTTSNKGGDRKQREFKQSRGHNRKQLATKKASKGMFMTS